MSIEQKIAEILAESRAAQIETEEVVVEETDINDPSDSSEENEANKKNNVDQQEVGGKDKASNVVTKDASAPEASQLKGVKEDVAALVNGEDLSEEFKQKAEIIFEAAVMNRVKQEVAKLDEAYEQKLVEQVEQIKEGLVEKVDGYLNYVVEQWIEQNEIALESGMKSDILESFVGGLKNLYAEHYIEVPQEKFDVLGALEEEVATLKAQLDEQLETNVTLNQQVATHRVAEIVTELAEGLVETDKEKFYSLVEELEFEGVESFQKKAQTIRESYFTKKASTTIVESVVTDAPVALIEEQVIPANMRQYVSALNVLK